MPGQHFVILLAATIADHTCTDPKSSVQESINNYKLVIMLWSSELPDVGRKGWMLDSLEDKINALPGPTD